MNDKLSINVEVLGLNTTDNYLVPSDMSVAQAIGLIVTILSEEYAGALDVAKNNHNLIQVSTGKVLLHSCSMRQLGIINGEKLILV